MTYLPHLTNKLFMSTESTKSNESKVVSADPPLVTKWLNAGFHELTERASERKGADTAEQMCQIGLPALFKSHEGYVAEPGDIAVCLKMSIEPYTGKISGSVCTLNPETGELSDRLTEEEDKARALFKAFVLDFPQAVLTSGEMQPLFLFRGKGKQRQCTGFVSLEELQKAKAARVQDLSVGVP